MVSTAVSKTKLPVFKFHTLVHGGNQTSTGGDFRQGLVLYRKYNKDIQLGASSNIELRHEAREGSSPGTFAGNCVLASGSVSTS